MDSIEKIFEDVPICFDETKFDEICLGTSKRPLQGLSVRKDILEPLPDILDDVERLFDQNPIFLDEHVLVEIDLLGMNAQVPQEDSVIRPTKRALRTKEDASCISVGTSKESLCIREDACLPPKKRRCIRDAFIGQIGLGEPHEAVNDTRRKINPISSRKPVNVNGAGKLTNVFSNNDAVAAGSSGLQPLFMDSRNESRLESNLEGNHAESRKELPVIGHSIFVKNKRHIKKYRGEETTYQVKMNDVPNNTPLSNVYDGFRHMLQTLIDTISKKFAAHDIVRMCLFSNGLDKPISMKATEFSNFTLDTILSTIEKILQYKEINLDESFRIEVITIRRPQGGKGGGKISNVAIDRLRKSSVITIQNDDHLCLARSVVVAMAKLKRDPQLKSIANSRRPLQKRLAVQLHEDAQVVQGPCGLKEVQRFEEHLKIQINIVDANSFNKVIYKGPEREEKIFIWYHHEHFDVITSMTGFLNSSYYCQTCDVGYSSFYKHRCPKICPTCYSSECTEYTSIECQNCNRICRSIECFNRHKTPKNAKAIISCDRFGLCKECHTIYPKSTSHVCGLSKCKSCKIMTDISTHLCFVQRLEPQPNHDKYIFFDFEAEQETGVHTVNFAIAHYYDGREIIFKGTETLQNFGTFAFSPKHKGYTFIAHNMQGYDGIFLMSYLLAQSVRPDVIMNGSKILSMKVPSLNIRVIDSYSFFPMSLSKLPKTFGLEELKKGYFPHLFNTT